MGITLTPQQEKELTVLGVATLYLFGSHAQGVAGPLSDYDFAVLLHDPALLRVPAKKEALYDALYTLLSPLCPRDLTNDVIDIVFLDERRTSLELQMNVIRNGTVLFDGDPRRRADFTEVVMERYCDFRPILDLFDRTILQSV